MVVGDQINTELIQQIGNLNKNIQELQTKNKLSERKILALRNAMMDTLLHYQQVQSKLEKQVNLQSKEIAQLKDSIKVILKKYYEALDERFLRQQEAFASVSEKLNTYISRAADLRDWMPSIKICFERSDAAQNYSRLIKEYNEVRDKINGDHEKDLSAVKHYWSDSESGRELEKTYDYLLNEVHHDTFLMQIGKINDYFKTAPARANQAQKVADNAKILMTQKIDELKKRSEIIIELMRDQI